MVESTRPAGECRIAPETPVQLRTLGQRCLTQVCTYCHGPTRGDCAVLCWDCLAAHHEDCFQEHDRCAAPGCGCQAYLRPVEVGRRPGRLRWALAAAFALGLLGWVIWPAARDPGAGDPLSARDSRQLGALLDQGDLAHAHDLLEVQAWRPDDGDARRLARELLPLVVRLQTPLPQDWTQLEQDCARVLTRSPAPPAWVRRWLRATRGRAHENAQVARQLVPVERALRAAQDAQPEDARRQLQRARELLAPLRGRPGDLWARVSLLAQRERELARHEDERAYTQAVGVVTVRDVASYATAIRLLRSIQEGALKYADAQAYLEWIGADQQVREAERAYDQGNAPRAIALLNQALRHEVLGPAARDSVRVRREKWSRVGQHFAAGLERARQGRIGEAQVELAQVLKGEPNPRNRFHELAKQKLRGLCTAVALSLEQKLKNGLRDLQAEEYESAAQWFTETREDPRARLEDLSAIRAAVARAAREQRLVDAVADDLEASRVERLLDDYFVLKLLQDWLPARQAQDATLVRYFILVSGRLQTTLGTPPERLPRVETQSHLGSGAHDR